MKSTAEQITKLPKWAQDHIATLQRERDVAIRELNEWVDGQTSSAMFVDEFISTGEKTGPSVKRRYFQGHKLEIAWTGIEATIILAEDDPQRPDGINISYNSKEGISHDVALLPKCSGSIALVSKERMR